MVVCYAATGNEYTSTFLFYLEKCLRTPPLRRGSLDARVQAEAQAWTQLNSRHSALAKRILFCTQEGGEGQHPTLFFIRTTQQLLPQC